MSKLHSHFLAVPEELIERKIFVLRGQKIMIDRDLADLYGVTTKALNQAVKRNLRRFPDDFMFRLSKNEFLELVTICDRFQTLKHSSAFPFAFTQNGVAMLSSVLKSERAILVNIQIMRAFNKLREMLSSHADLRRKILEMEQKYDTQFQEVFLAIRKLLDPPRTPKIKKEIGFHTRMG